MPVMDIYHDYEKPRVQGICRQDDVVNSALDGIRRFVTAMQSHDLEKQNQKQARELTEYAIALKTAGDIIVQRLLPLAKTKCENSIRFSKAGREELMAMHERVIANMALAFNVLISDDLESARLLLEEKGEMARMERASRKKHLKRLGKGAEVSFDSSDIHLDTLRALREFNSHVAAVAYPILYRGGQLLETRLIEAIGDEDTAE